MDPSKLIIWLFEELKLRFQEGSPAANKFCRDGVLDVLKEILQMTSFRQNRLLLLSILLYFSLQSIVFLTLFCQVAFCFLLRRSRLGPAV